MPPIITGWFWRVTSDLCMGLVVLTNTQYSWGEAQWERPKQPWDISGEPDWCFTIRPNFTRHQHPTRLLCACDGVRWTWEHSVILSECIPELKQGLKHSSDPTPTSLASMINSSSFTNYSFSSVPFLHLPNEHSERQIRCTFSLVVTGNSSILFAHRSVAGGVWLGASNGSYYWGQYVPIICWIKWLATMWVSRDVKSSLLIF